MKLKEPLKKMKIGLVVLSIVILLIVAGCARETPTFCEKITTPGLEYKELEELVKPIVTNAENVENIEEWLKTQPCIREVTTKWSEPTKGQILARLSEDLKMLVININKDLEQEKIIFETVYISEMRV